MHLPKNPVATAALTVLLIALAYLPALSGGFIWDDDDYVTENKTLHEPGGLLRIWTDTRATPQYYPLVHTSFWLEYQAWGLKPAGYHATNILIHALATLLLWRVLLRLELPWAWLAALLFGLHPVGVESVVWITERKNVLSAMFYFASALTYLRFAPATGMAETYGRLKTAGKKNSNLPQPHSAWRFYYLALGLFICALLSKTVTCSLPAALLLVYWWKRGQITKRDLLPLLPFFLIGLLLAMNTSHLEKHHVGAKGADWEIPFIERFLIAGRVLWFYAGKLLWPANLTFIYPRWTINAAAWWQWLFPAGAAAVVGTLWFARNKIGRGPLVAVLFFAGTLFPALGFFNVYPMRYSFVADHFQYLASIGLITLAAAGLWRVASARTSVLGLLVITLGILTWQQARIYHTLEDLWRDTIRKNPSCWLALNNLGLMRKLAGDTREAETLYQTALRHKPGYEEAANNYAASLIERNELDQAIPLLERALQANTNSPNLLLNYGVALRKKGHPELAMEYYQRSLALQPDSPDTLNNLGTALAEQKRYAEAKAAFEAALNLQPNQIETKINLANILNLLGENSNAEGDLRETIRSNPENVMAHEELAKALAAQGRNDEALQEYETITRLKPGNATAHYNAGYLLALQGKSEAARQKFLRAIELNPDYAEAHNNLGITLSIIGRFTEATNHFTTALHLKPDYAEAHNNFAFALANLSQRELAIHHLREALRLQPNYPQAEAQLRQLLSSGGKN